MKLPFHKLLNPIIKPYYGSSSLFCRHPTFCISVFYTYIYGTIGFLINVNHLRIHMGEHPESTASEKELMIIHDLKIIGTSMAIVQYACLLFGCYTPITETAESVRIKLRALLVALLGVSMSACAFASQPVELELEDDEIAQKLNNVSVARRITKPTIRMVIGYGKLSAFITAVTSLLLLVAVMSKQSWWHHGARWLVAPALLVAALEVASDAGDAMLAAVLRGNSEPVRVITQTVAAGLLVTVEILVWYFIAKFFEHDPPQIVECRKEPRT